MADEGASRPGVVVVPSGAPVADVAPSPSGYDRPVPSGVAHSAGVGSTFAGVESARTTSHPRMASGKAVRPVMAGVPYPGRVDIAVARVSRLGVAGALVDRPTIGTVGRAGRMAPFGGSAWVVASGEVVTIVRREVNVGFAPRLPDSVCSAAPVGRGRWRVRNNRTVRSGQLYPDRHWTAATNADKLANRRKDWIRGSGT